MLNNTPILVGSGQYVDRQAPDPARSLSPADMAAEAARRALHDSGAADALAKKLDVIAVARLFEHSVRDHVMWPNPFGASNNMPASVARRLGIRPRRKIYAEVGGETPQRLVNQMAESIHAGEVDAALLTGAEALATIRNARRAGIEFDWNEEIDEDFEDLWPDLVMASDYELRHGIALPIHVYALFEQARRHQLGLNLADYRKDIGRLFEPLAARAADNPYAQFPNARSAMEIATPSEQNFPLCEPYTKWMVAQDAVNQGAAVVMTSVGLATELGIDPQHWVYLHAYADVDELAVVQRPNLSRSAAQGLALNKVLDDAAVGVDEIDLIDLYSCFPIAVSGACDHLNIAADGSRAVSLTGGLPFFGGPGNNYSLHAIAEVVRQLRGREEATALIAANGGYLSKHSAGLYSRSLKGEWQTRSSSAAQAALHANAQPEVVETAEGSATIESYAAVYDRGTPAGGFIAARLANGARALAVVRPDDSRARECLFEEQPFERVVQLSHVDGVNYFTVNE